jgi:succinate dehydrogenase / fumarate reductase, iron-sulfur subunit
MKLTLAIHRSVDGKEWIQNYEIEIKKGMTILEGLHEIKANQDASLSFTCSCRSSICGACAVRVNKNAELACEALLVDLAKRYQTEKLELEPLANFKVLRDLIVDWQPKYERMQTIHPRLNPKEEFSLDKGCIQTPAEFDRYKKYAGCILCGACVSECNKNTLNQKNFLDPFIFVKAAKLVEDSRDRNPEEHLKAVVEAGLWRCMECQECTAKCPKDLDPAGAIEKLKAATFRLKLKETVGSNHAKAVYDDLHDSGMLDEKTLATRTEGVFLSALRAPVAVRLMTHGKLNMLERHPVNPEIKTIQAIMTKAKEVE